VPGGSAGGAGSGALGIGGVLAVAAWGGGGSGATTGAARSARDFTLSAVGRFRMPTSWVEGGVDRSGREDTAVSGASEAATGG
jgi:hypothetical protein